MGSASRIVGEPLQTLKWTDGSRVLLKPLVVDVLGYRIRIEADEDFKTDFSSIPPFGRWIVRWSRVDVAGVVHDWLYQTVGRGSVSTELHKEKNLRSSVTRKEADEIWRLIALSGNHRASRIGARVCWLALRVAAWPVWNAYHRRDGRWVVAPVATLSALGGGLIFVVLSYRHDLMDWFSALCRWLCC